MRHRVAALVVTLLVAFPASAGFEYTFEGAVTVDHSGFFAPGTQISGRLLWSPENAVHETGSIYSNVFSYEYNIGGFLYASPASPDAVTSDGIGLLYDITPTRLTGSIEFDEILFTSTFAFTSLNMDLSGLWHTDIAVFMPGPGLNIADVDGYVVMTQVPEPGTLGLFASAFALAALFRRRRSLLLQ